MLALRCCPSYPSAIRSRTSSRFADMNRFEPSEAAARAHAPLPVASTDARQLAKNRPVPASRWLWNGVTSCRIMGSSWTCDSV
jgi:hypothetical protein